MDEASLRQCGPHRVADYENRLVEVKHGGAPVAAFEYDGLGRRIKSTVGSVVTRFIYDGDAVIEEYGYDSGWVLAAVYVHGIGVDNVLTITRDANVYYYHYDGYGSVSELTDEDGALAQAYEYDAWGNATIYDPESAIENPYLYTGRRWDAAIGLYYYRARHYAPTLGRFLQPDPIGYGDGTNLYVYVSGTPTVFIDPSGMQGSTDSEFWDKHGKAFVERLREWEYTGSYDLDDWYDCMGAVGALPEELTDAPMEFFMSDLGNEMLPAFYRLPEKEQAFVAGMIQDRARHSLDRRLAGHPAPKEPTWLTVTKIAIESTFFDDLSVVLRGEHMHGGEASRTDTAFAFGGLVAGALGTVPKAGKAGVKGLRALGKGLGKADNLVKAAGKHADEVSDFGKHLDEVAKNSKRAVHRAAGALEEAQGLGESRKLINFAPRVPAGDDQAKYGLAHIIRRHGFQNADEGVSKFAHGMGQHEIRGAIEEAAGKAAKWDVQGSKRVVDVNVGRVIGTDRAGVDTSWVRIVTDSEGSVITAYPVPATGR